MPPPKRQITAFGRTMSVPEWAATLGLSRTALYNAEDNGRPDNVEDMMLSANGRRMTKRQWAEERRISVPTLNQRLRMAQAMVLEGRLLARATPSTGLHQKTG
jgi:hypothetical protein